MEPRKTASELELESHQAECDHSWRSDMPVATSPSNSAALALHAVNWPPPRGGLRAIAGSYS